jgi:hypothetical protein
MSADSWTLEESEEYLEFAPPLVNLEVKFLDSLDWRQLHRLANYYNLNIRGDQATYLSQLKATWDRAIARVVKTTTPSSTAGSLTSLPTGQYNNEICVSKLAQNTFIPKTGSNPQFLVSLSWTLEGCDW